MWPGIPVHSNSPPPPRRFIKSRILTVTVDCQIHRKYFQSAEIIREQGFYKVGTFGYELLTFEICFSFFFFISYLYSISVILETVNFFFLKGWRHFIPLCIIYKSLYIKMCIFKILLYLWEECVQYQIGSEDIKISTAWWPSILCHKQFS